MPPYIHLFVQKLPILEGCFTIDSSQGKCKYDRDNLMAMPLIVREKINHEKLAIYDQIISAVVNQVGVVYFMSDHVYADN
jgi:hypothetical protein